MSNRSKKGPNGESLAENLARARAQVEDRMNKQAAADRRRRRQARRDGVLPRKQKPESPLDLVKKAFQKKTYNQ